MSTTTTSTAPDRSITSDGPGYRFAISIPGYRFTGVPRPELTDEQAQAFSESGSEQAFYDNVELLRTTLDSDFMPEA